ncbi:hypothetical protein ACLOJK_017804 [Asimina triloba]
MVETMSFPQTAPNDDAPKRLGSFMSPENQETKVPEKSRKEEISTMFENPLIAGLRSAFSLVRERISLRREKVGPLKPGSPVEGEEVPLLSSWSLIRHWETLTIGMSWVLSHSVSSEGDLAWLKKKRSGGSFQRIDRYDEGSGVVEMRENLINVLHLYLILCEEIKKGKEIANEVENGVAGWRRRGIGVAVAAHVRRDGSVASSCEGVDLVPPRIPQLWEAMEEQDNGAPFFAFLRHVQPYTIHRYRLMLDAVLHFFFLISKVCWMVDFWAAMVYLSMYPLFS